VEDSNSISTRARDDADQRLLQRVVARDRDAFRELYLGYHRRLARFLMRITRRHDLAEEVINDTLWAVWRQAQTFRGESRVSTWIMSIAYRRALKALDQLKRAPSDSAMSPDDALLLAPDEVSESEVNEWILLGLQQLPNEQRLVLELAYDFGYSCEEIARIVDCPINTVKTRMFHARRKLRDILPALAGTTVGGEDAGGE
jgi:RNA polymerase sigma-70 factor, ECF subfamily